MKKQRIFAAIMNVALLSLGTNTNREYNMMLCCLLLSDVYPNLAYSGTSITKPYGKRYKYDFLNRLAILSTNQSQEEVKSTLKNIEKLIGRTDMDKESGLIKIDIDLVIWNNELLKPEDMKRSYIQDLLPTLPPLNNISF